MFNPPLNIGRRVLNSCMCVAAFGCGPKLADCTSGCAVDQTIGFMPIIETENGSTATAFTAPYPTTHSAFSRPFDSDFPLKIETQRIDTDVDTVAYTVSGSRKGSPPQGGASTHLDADTVSATDCRESNACHCTVTPSDGTDGAALAGKIYLLPASTTEREKHGLANADSPFDGAITWGAAAIGPDNLNGHGWPAFIFEASQGESTEGAHGRSLLFWNA